MATNSTEERYRDLIEKIDPSIKKTRLDAEKKALSERFLEAYNDAHSQSKLTIRHRQAFEEAPKVGDLTEDEIRQANDLLGRSRVAAHRAALEQILDTSVEVERQRVLLMDHWALELERVVEELDKLAKVGVVEKPESAA